MSKDVFGRVYFTQDELIELLYQDPHLDISRLEVEAETARKYNLSKKNFYIDSTDLAEFIELSDVCTQEEFDEYHQQQWFMPGKYQSMDIQAWLQAQCQSQNQRARIDEELEEFRKRNLVPLLQYLKYLVDTLREQKVVWGVGRGSSVASYALYKIGVHKIDSMKYGLEWQEFLR
jgi:DNA polymerase III alpha subunit